MLFGLIASFWAALHLSQSLIDLADLLLILMALKIAYQQKDFRNLWTSFKWPLLGPIWVAVIGLGFVFGAPTEAATAAKLMWEFRWFLSFICFIYLFKKIVWGESQLRVFTLILLAISILDVALFFVNYDKDPRAGGMFQHSMPFAHTMGPSALLLLFVGIKKALDKSQPMLWLVIYFVAPAVLTGLVVLSFTRGIWIGFVVALLVCTLALGRKVFVTTVGILVLAGVILFAGSSRIQTRVMGKTNAESQSNNERLLYWKANLQIFKDYPVFGIGYSQNNVHVEEYLKKDGIEWLTGAHAHNQFIHFLAGTGLLGLGCFLTFLTLVFLPVSKKLLVWRQSKLTTDQAATDQYYLLLGAFAAMVCFIVGSLTESNFSIAKNRFVFLFIAALAYAISTSISKKSGKE